MRTDKSLKPVVKWAGGKRQILAEIVKHIPRDLTTYYEPFLGGGAVLFELQPERAVVNDLNRELINLYQVIKNQVDELIEDLRKHKNEKGYFYRLRALDRDRGLYVDLTPVQKASRVIYLNKTCYNGLFRVNKAGEFNTPFGRYKNPKIVNEVGLRAVSDYLNRASVSITCQDFEQAVKGAESGSFVYFDPPYDPVSQTADFTAYAEGGFSREEQERLKRTCDRLNEKGIRFLLSNSATDFIKELYQGYRIEIIQAKRSVNSVAARRGGIDEVLLMNFEPGKGS
ncbi:DNA adenine methylase [Acididesulfobacillus acetoxydans]|uniref:DNA adenine methylase n=1 Tax=Acididesulfobacillus acetoxydans TaxID=1561005 RepID=UPI001F0FF118|nr:DNA adenine methylase [Acididesulfobacillus acetoxydans]